jgi:hypothetical protein
VSPPWCPSSLLKDRADLAAIERGDEQQLRLDGQPVPDSHRRVELDGEVAEDGLSSNGGDVAPQGGSTMRPNAPSFERLEQAVTIIAQHADYPGKQESVAECLDDIDDRWSRGLLDSEQRFGLRATLLRGRTSQRDRTSAA